jgi:predicted esterase
LLAGFSQGGMLALDYLLQTGDPRVSGLAVFSASRIALAEWLPLQHRLAGMPVLLAHGRQDTHLSFEAGEALHALL